MQISDDNSISVVMNTVDTPSDETLCGHVYLILALSFSSLVDYRPSNNWMADDVFIVCDVTGESVWGTLTLVTALLVDKRFIPISIASFGSQTP